MPNVIQTQAKNLGNSGASAIALADHGGADTIIMLGYDCKPAADGRRHWHNDHPVGLDNAKGIHTWTARFDRLRDHLRTSTRVINATADTALTQFDRMQLHDALATC